MSDLLLPVLFLGIFAAICWFVIRPQIRDGFRQMAESRRKMGSTKFAATMIGTFSFIGLWTWLAFRLDYPDAYGHPCHGKSCFFHDIYYSPVLLHGHRWDEVALFTTLWTVPATLVFAAAVALKRKLKNTKFSLYSDDTEN